MTTVTLTDLIEENAEPCFVKIDIEGMDSAALDPLRSSPVRPKNISIESAFPRDASFRNAKAELAAVGALGNDRFKIVPQHEVQDQVPPRPPRGGHIRGVQVQQRVQRVVW